MNEAARALAVAQARRWAWQRLSAAVLGLCVLVHLAVIIWAVRSGLSGAAILGRTRGHPGVAAFYAVFVLACAVHVPIGVAAVAREWAGWSERGAQWLARGFGLLLLLAGGRAVWAVCVGAGA